MHQLLSVCVWYVIVCEVFLVGVVLLYEYHTCTTDVVVVVVVVGVAMRNG